MESSVLVFAGLSELREFMWDECWAVLGNEGGEYSDDDIRPGCRQAFDLGPEAFVSNVQLVQYREHLCEILVADMVLSTVKTIGNVEVVK